jgi:hypothetical protein
MTMPLSVHLKPRTRRTPERLQLRVELARIKPVIWRRIVVPESITLPKLHQVIQITMGWSDVHLHNFEIAYENYGVPDPDFDFGHTIRPEQRVRLKTALGDARLFRYTYDFGDNWEHRIKVEKRLAPEPDLAPYAFCLDGANACPPEDVGSEPGYADFVAAMADPRHPDHHAMLSWYGRAFDPTCFDFIEVNLALQNLKI